MRGYAYAYRFSITPLSLVLSNSGFRSTKERPGRRINPAPHGRANEKQWKRAPFVCCPVTLHDSAVPPCLPIIEINSIADTLTRCCRRPNCTCRPSFSVVDSNYWNVVWRGKYVNSIHVLVAHLSTLPDTFKIRCNRLFPGLKLVWKGYKLACFISDR